MHNHSRYSLASCSTQGQQILLLLKLMITKFSVMNKNKCVDVEIRTLLLVSSPFEMGYNVGETSLNIFMYIIYHLLAYKF